MKKPIQPVQGRRVYSGIQERKKEKNSDYFDDCLICQGMKKAEEEGKNLNIEEMEELFRKANEKN